jgi:putative ABC transport system ATP-binding protein
LSEKGQTILVVKHDPEVAKKCSRILRITEGIIKDY